MRRVRHCTKCDCYGICYILLYQQMFRAYINVLYYWQNVFAAGSKWLCGQDLARGRSLETPGLTTSALKSDELVISAAVQKIKWNVSSKRNAHLKFSVSIALNTRESTSDYNQKVTRSSGQLQLSNTNVARLAPQIDWLRSKKVSALESTQVRSKLFWIICDVRVCPWANWH